MGYFSWEDKISLIGLAPEEQSKVSNKSTLWIMDCVSATFCNQILIFINNTYNIFDSNLCQSIRVHVSTFHYKRLYFFVTSFMWDLSYGFPIAKDTFFCYHCSVMSNSLISTFKNENDHKVAMKSHTSVNLENLQNTRKS